MHPKDIVGAKFGHFVRLVSINAVVLLLGLIVVELVLGNWFGSYVFPTPRTAVTASRTMTFRQNLYQPPSMVTLTQIGTGCGGCGSRYPQSNS